MTAPLAIETRSSTAASHAKNTGYGFQLSDTAPGPHAYNDREADDTSEFAALCGAKGYSVISGSKRNFYHVHVRTPSENTVGGQPFLLEALSAHQLDDEALRGTYHRLAVNCLRHELGSDAECNDFLDKFRKSLSMRRWSPNTRVRSSP